MRIFVSITAFISGVWFRASRFILDDTTLAVTLSVVVAKASGDDTDETLLKTGRCGAIPR